MRSVVKWTMLAVIGLVVVAGIIYAARPQPVPVDLASVNVAPMQMTVDEEGKTRICERYIVSSPLTGRLRRIALHPGDPLEAERTVLAVIEPTDPALLDARALAESEARVSAADAAVRHAGATIERARAAYDFAENELARLTEAFRKGGANQREVDEAMTRDRTTAEEFQAAQLSKEIARFELEVARSALLYAKGDAEIDERARMPLYSPIDGVVLRVFQESVAVVTPGTALIEVGDPHDLELVIDVLSTDAVMIRPGNRIIIGHWGGEMPLEGVVRLVEPSAFTKISALGIEEQRVNVIADFVTPSEDRATLGDGFRVEANIVVWEQQDVLQIPTSAAFRDDLVWAVFAIKDGRAVLRSIEVGRQNGRTTQVVSGLVAGERVIVYPSDQLAQGVRVVER